MSIALTVILTVIIHSLLLEKIFSYTNIVLLPGYSNGHVNGVSFDNNYNGHNNMNNNNSNNNSQGNFPSSGTDQPVKMEMVSNNSSNSLQYQMQNGKQSLNICNDIFINSMNYFIAVILCAVILCAVFSFLIAEVCDHMLKILY